MDSDEDINNMELDMSWVDELNETINKYKIFYKEVCTNIYVYYLYVSKTNELAMVKKEKIKLQNGICKGEIISSKNELKDYTIESVSKFNIDIDPQEIVNGIFFRETKESEYFTTYNTLQDIEFRETIFFLQNINTLFVLLKEKIEENKQENKVGEQKKKIGKKTKRVSFVIQGHHNKTRKR
jgi:hypothetical protein